MLSQCTQRSCRHREAHSSAGICLALAHFEGSSKKGNRMKTLSTCLAIRKARDVVAPLPCACMPNPTSQDGYMLPTDSSGPLEPLNAPTNSRIFPARSSKPRASSVAFVGRARCAGSGLASRCGYTRSTSRLVHWRPAASRDRCAAFGALLDGHAP